MEICSRMVKAEQKGRAIFLSTDGPKIKICFLTPEIVRVRVSFDGDFEEESYVLSVTGWEDRLDFLFEGERERIEPICPSVREDDETIKMETSKVALIITKNPFNMALYNREGILLYSDVSGYAFVKDSNGRRIHYNKISREDAFYGFGEKTGHLNKTRKFMRMSGKDAMAWNPIDGDPLYKHIPFYIKLNEETRAAVGLFYHNTYESAFCMGAEVGSIERAYSYFQTDGGDIDLFLIAGDKMSRILDNYTFLTGRPVMLPKRALGYQGSGMLYSELPRGCEEAIMQFVNTVREEGYPLDGFYLSSGYTAQLDNKRCVFTWCKERYENPGRLFSRLEENGAPVVPNIKPGVLLCHPLFDEMKEEGVFVQDSEGSDVAVGRWWGGDGAFWDFTKPEGRKAWKRYMTKTLLELGAKSIWNDNCEYDGLLDHDSICDFDGKKGTIGQLRPIMPNLMGKMAKEAIAEYDADVRPYILSRGGFSGIQKYAQTWCGDNVTSWDALKYNIPTILGMSMSGVPNQGSDVGGFVGKAPDPELFVRFIQNGIFQPRFCIHSANTDFTATEPWMYPEVNEIVREAFLFRYQLTPYLYTAEYRAHMSGEPIMRPLVYDFQQDRRCWNEDVEFMFGQWLLVANVVEPGAETRKIYLPEGCRWYDFYTYQCYEGGQEIEIPVSLKSIPLFVKEGAILPIAANQIKNMEKEAVTDLRLMVLPSAKSEYEMYDDDGVSNQYQNGVFRKTRFHVNVGERTAISVEKSGTYKDTIQNVQIELVSPETAPFHVCLNKVAIPRCLGRKEFEDVRRGWFYELSRRVVLIKFENPADDYMVELSWTPFTALVQ